MGYEIVSQDNIVFQLKTYMRYAHTFSSKMNYNILDIALPIQRLHITVRCDIVCQYISHQKGL